MPDLTGEVVADEACSLSVTQSPAAGTVLPPGDHTVTLTASDGFQSDTCQAIVSVSSNVPNGVQCGYNTSGSLQQVVPVSTGQTCTVSLWVAKRRACISPSCGPGTAGLW